MIKIWSEEDDTRRVTALLVISELLKKQPDYLGFSAKAMYTTFVKNAKFVTPLTAGRITFMLKSVIETYRADLDEGYLHAFVFIRQLAITLRKAYTTNTKQEMQAVYNWQFINSMKLWCEFVADYGAEHERIQTLLQPLVNIILGTIRLNPAERWLPLRFHCVSMLHTLSGSKRRLINMDASASEEEVPTSFCYIPSLPIILEVFRVLDLNRRPARASKQPFDLRLMLHFSPSQRMESASLDASVDWLHDLLVEALALSADSPAFPETVAILLIQLKSAVKACKVVRFVKLFNGVIAAVREHSQFIVKARKDISQITDLKKIEAFRLSQMVNENAPFKVFYKRHLVERLQVLKQLSGLKHQASADGEVDWDQEVKETKKLHADEDASAGKKTADKRKRAAHDSDEDSESSSDSDASYDIDDGTNLVHVSKKDRNKAENEDDSDFDLEAALEAEEPMEDDAISVATTNLQEDQDLLSDFDLSDYETETEKKAKTTKKKTEKNVKNSKKSKKVATKKSRKQQKVE